MKGITKDGAIDLIGLGIILVLVLSYLAWKKLSLPAWVYPSYLWGQFATVLDQIASAFLSNESNTKRSMDHWLGGVGVWLIDNLGNYPSRGTYSDTAPTEINAGGTYGTAVSDYWEPGAQQESYAMSDGTTGSSNDEILKQEAAYQ